MRIFIYLILAASLLFSTIVCNTHKVDYKDETKFTNETWVRHDEKLQKAAKQVKRINISKKEFKTPQKVNGGLTKSKGVNYYNGMKETYYSSRIMYHYLTPQWHLDAEGFWRDKDGYYVVSCNKANHAYNEVFMTSKGLARRWDTGCVVGVIDFYVNW